MSNNHTQSLEVLCRVIYRGLRNDLLVSLTVVREVSLGKSTIQPFSQLPLRIMKEARYPDMNMSASSPNWMDCSSGKSIPSGEEEETTIEGKA